MYLSVKKWRRMVEIVSAMKPTPEVKELAAILASQDAERMKQNAYQLARYHAKKGKEKV